MLFFKICDVCVVIVFLITFNSIDFFFFFLLLSLKSFWLMMFWIVDFIIAYIAALFIFSRIWSEIVFFIACLTSCCTWEVFADVKMTSKSFLRSMYVTVVLKDVVEWITILYCCDCFNFLKEKCWSTNAELNERKFVSVHVFLIFNDVIASCWVYWYISRKFVLSIE